MHDKLSPREVEEIQIKGVRLHKKLLEKGERPDMRPWGGRFEAEDGKYILNPSQKPTKTAQ